MFGNRKHTKKDCKITVIEKTDLIIYDGSYYKKYDHNDIEELRLLNLTIKKLNQMAFTLDQVLQSVTDNATVGGSAIALLKGIKKQLDDVLSGVNLPPAAQKKVDAIFAVSEADKQKLEEAIIANTPSEEPTEEPPVEPPVV